MKKMQSIARVLAIAAAVGAANANTQAPAAGRTEFSPAKGVQAVLTVRGQVVELNLASRGGDATETFAVETAIYPVDRARDYAWRGGRSSVFSSGNNGI